MTIRVTGMGVGSIWITVRVGVPMLRRLRDCHRVRAGSARRQSTGVDGLGRLPSLSISTIHPSERTADSRFDVDVNRPVSWVGDSGINRRAAGRMHGLPRPAMPLWSSVTSDAI